MLGRLLGTRYQVIQVLGSGAFGQTYVAQDIQRPGKPQCVVKHLKPINSEPTFLLIARRLFYTEAETLEKLGQHDRIPQLLAYFEENQEFYLLQEFIEGQPLSEELRPGKEHSEAYVLNLLEDVLKILEFVHAQGVVHRDIKPSNLIRRQDGKLVLIDFGAVKEIRAQPATGSSQTDLTVSIGTRNYMPSEQLAGKPRFNSDIYAVGIIGIQALTGLRPSQLSHDLKTSEIVWRDRIQVSDELAAILDKMVRCHCLERYQSATEVLAALHQIPLATSTSISPLWNSLHFPIAKKSVAIGVGVTIATLTVLMVGKSVLAPSVNPVSTASTPNSNQTASASISFGTKILVPGPIDSAKQTGVDLIEAGAYDRAVAVLEAAHKRHRDDPETLIYLNNARIGKNRAYEIAAAVPLGSTPPCALEVLRGVAQAQKETNQAGGIDGVPLKVVIAKDDDRPGTAKAIAKKLVENPKILGVVGHGASDATLAAGSVYQSGELVTISPISSAVQLTGFSPYVFRTMPSDRFTAKALSNYMLQKLHQQKAAIFFNSASVYSQSLRTEFKNALFYSDVGKVVAEFDLAKPEFNAYEHVEQSIKQGAEVILLAADSTVTDRALQVVQMNRHRLKLLAGDTVYTRKTLQIGRDAAVGMVVAVPVDMLSTSTSQFRASAVKLWGGEVSWRTALAYDATQSLITAIQRHPTRPRVQRSLSATDFSAPGATGSVKFLPSGDRQGFVQLVTVTHNTSGNLGDGCEFKPLN